MAPSPPLQIPDILLDVPVDHQRYCLSLDPLPGHILIDALVRLIDLIELVPQRKYRGLRAETIDLCDVFLVILDYAVTKFIEIAITIDIRIVPQFIENSDS